MNNIQEVIPMTNTTTGTRNIELDPSILGEAYLDGVQNIIGNISNLMDEEDERQKNMEHPYYIRQIFRDHPECWDENSGVALSQEQRNAAWSIANCKTRDIGDFTAEYCPKCGYSRLHYRSCGNRNCPNCQYASQLEWVANRKLEVVPGQPYYHLIFTCDHRLNILFAVNQKPLIALFFTCVSAAIIEFCKDPRYLGATPGIISVLHSWTQDLRHHWHLHCIVSGCGLTDDQRFVSILDVNRARHASRNSGNAKVTPTDDKGGEGSSDTFEGNDYFLPMKPLMNLVRNKFMDGLRKLWEERKLIIPESHPEWNDLTCWSEYCNDIASTKWVGKLVKAFHGQGKVDAIEYLARYVYRTAISNSRILSYDGKNVTFSVRDNDNPGETLTKVLPADEFIHRFLSHVLDKGISRVRYSGFLSNSQRAKNLRLIAALTQNASMLERWPSSDITNVCEGSAAELTTKSEADMSADELILKYFEKDICKCPNCQAQMIVWPPRMHGKPLGDSAVIPQCSPEKRQHIDALANRLKAQYAEGWKKIRELQKRVSTQITA